MDQSSGRLQRDGGKGADLPFFTLMSAAEFRERGHLFPCHRELLRSLDRKLSYQDKIDERDERNLLVKLHAKSLTCSIVQYALLGACVLCTVGAVLYKGNPDGQQIFGGMLVVSGVMWFVSLLSEMLCLRHYEKRL